MPEIVSSGSGPMGSGDASASSVESGGTVNETSNDSLTPYEVPLTEEGSEASNVSDSGQENVSEGGKPQSAAQKKKSESQFARTKRQRAAFQAEKAAFAQERAEWQRQQQEVAEKAKGPKFDLGELKTFREQWKAEENWELVEKADAKIKELEAEEGQKTAQVSKVQVWHQAEKELSANDPDFLKQGTRLDTRLREIMASADGDIYRQHERGIIAAYHRAKMELLQEDHTELQKKFQALEQEHQRVTGLTSISGGTPGRMGGNGQRDFASLSMAEMRKHLMAGRSRAPWI
jgi:hypothetical protein